MAEEYTTIDLRIYKRDPENGRYPVEASVDGGGEYHDSLNIDPEKLLAKQIDPKAYGLELFSKLFHGRIREAYGFVSGRADKQSDGRLRVRLRIDDGAPELHAVRWEALYHTYREEEIPLAISADTPFSRYTALEASEAMPLQQPLRLLFAIANPSDLANDGLASLAVDAEVRSLVKALGKIDPARLELQIMPGRTGLSKKLHRELNTAGIEIVDGASSLENLTQHLSGCHIFHFLGHGVYSESGKEAVLVLERGNKKKWGKSRWVPDAEVTNRLRPLKNLRLVFLAACESANRETDRVRPNPYVGLAPKLVQAGVPAVVAMQDQVEIDAARQLTTHFYGELLRHGFVDQALNNARYTLYSDEDEQWTIPVLYMRLAEGRLFFTAARPGVTYHYLNPPAHYVSRPQVSERLEERLLHGAGAPAITFIHGLAASGKTTFAKALAQAVWSYFIGGVFWITLGQEPEISKQLAGIIQELGDYDYQPITTTVEQASQHLDRLMAESQSQILFVLDDAWEYEHLIPFLVGGSRCHVLITSRRRSVLSHHSGQPTIYRLRQLTENQALDMLAKMLHRTTDPPFAPKEREEALILTKAVGRLPMALELASRRIADGSSSWQKMTKALETEIARLEELDPDPGRRRRGSPKVEASINVSLRRLREEFEPDWEALVWLGVLPEDATISAPAAATLWQASTEETSDILTLLNDENLLLEAPAQKIDGRLWPAYTLHDVVHDVARRQLTTDSPRGLSFTWRKANRKFLSRYKTRHEKYIANNILQWHLLPDDGYIHGHLARHMAAAGRYDDLQQLVLDRRWRESQRQVQGDTRSTLNDLQLTLNLALDRDDVVTVLDCVATYRETAHVTSIIDALYDALNSGDLRKALSLAVIKSPIEDWGVVLHLYVAWEAALVGEEALSREAVEQAKELRLIQADDLCDALIVRTALALAGDDLVRAKEELALLGKDEESDNLLKVYAPVQPLPDDKAQDDIELQNALDDLDKQVQVLALSLSTHEGDSLLARRITGNEMVIQYADGTRPGSEEQTSEETVLANLYADVFEPDSQTQVAGLATIRSQLVKVGVCTAGRRLLEVLVEILKYNLYPRYRDAGLIDCAIACLHVQDDSWMRQIMQSIIHTGLDREGVVFTFDLPFQLLEAAVDQDLDEEPTVNLSLYQQAALAHSDRWGTRLRALSAMAGSLFRRQNRQDDAISALMEATQEPIGFAGYGVLHMLALADRWRELGKPIGGNPEKDRAVEMAGMVENKRFQHDRQKLVKAFNDWWQEETIATKAGLERLEAMEDTDTRLVFLEHLSARWASRVEGPNWEGLKALLPVALVHGTGSFRDAILGRLFGVYLNTHKLEDEKLIRAIEICERPEMLNRSWEIGDKLPFEELFGS